MLTAESEGGQRKAHPYWDSNSFGSLKVKSLSEKKVLLESSSRSHLLPKLKKPSYTTPSSERTPRSRSATISPGAERDETSALPGSEPPSCIVRKLTLNHMNLPFQPLREITQVHFANWPDFGAPTNATDILGLIEKCGAIIKSANGGPNTRANLPAESGERPVLVHCSAGCGRTGTFCTIDSVIDMLKRQMAASHRTDENEMELDSAEWIRREDIDLVQKAVEDFRKQRLSLVQNLRQYVLCYETVLEWFVKEMPEKFQQRDTLRRTSYAG